MRNAGHTPKAGAFSRPGARMDEPTPQRTPRRRHSSASARSIRIWHPGDLEAAISLEWQWDKPPQARPGGRSPVTRRRPSCSTWSCATSVRSGPRPSGLRSLRSPNLPFSSETTSSPIEVRTVYTKSSDTPRTPESIICTPHHCASPMNEPLCEGVFHGALSACPLRIVKMAPCGPTNVPAGFPAPRYGDDAGW